MSATPDVKAMFGADAVLLAHSARGDGRHFVVKARAASGEFVVVKQFGRKRGVLRDTLRDVGQRFFVGKTGMQPDRRVRTERDTLTLWRSEGFDVPRLLDESAGIAPLLARPGVDPRRTLVMEFIDGRLLDAVIADPTVTLSEKERLVTRVAREMSRRHARAAALDEPLLIQLHATLDHLLYEAATATRPERLVSFDFEVAWSHRHSTRFAAEFEFARELASLHRRAPPSQLAVLMAAFERGYGKLARHSVASSSGAAGG